MPFYWARELQHRSHQVALSIFVILRNEDGSECLCFCGANRFEENAKISADAFCIQKRSVFLCFRPAFSNPVMWPCADHNVTRNQPADGIWIVLAAEKSSEFFFGFL